MELPRNQGRTAVLGPPIDCQKWKQIDWDHHEMRKKKVVWYRRETILDIPSHFFPGRKSTKNDKAPSTLGLQLSKCTFPMRLSLEATHNVTRHWRPPCDCDVIYKAFVLIAFELITEPWSIQFRMKAREHSYTQNGMMIRTRKKVNKIARAAVLVSLHPWKSLYFVLFY